MQHAIVESILDTIPIAQKVVTFQAAHQRHQGLQAAPDDEEHRVARCLSKASWFQGDGNGKTFVDEGGSVSFQNQWPR